MRTIDADILLNNSWNKLSEAEDVVSDLITDLSSSDHFYESPSDAQSFKNFESALLQIQHRILELQAHIGLALKSRTKGMIVLKDKTPPLHGIVALDHEKPFIVFEQLKHSVHERVFTTLPTVANCIAESGVKYPEMAPIPEDIEFACRRAALEAGREYDKQEAQRRATLAKELVNHES